MSEIWKDIKDFEGYYQVSSLGRIRSLDRVKSTYGGRSYAIKGAIKSIRLNNISGYSQITLSKDGKKRVFTIHRLVGLNHIPNPNNLPELNHEDGNKQNNAVSNLKWCDKNYNHQHACKTGLWKMNINHKNALLKRRHPNSKVVHIK